MYERERLLIYVMTYLFAVRWNSTKSRMHTIVGYEYNVNESVMRWKRFDCASRIVDFEFEGTTVIRMSHNITRTVVAEACVNVGVVGDEEKAGVG